MKHDVYTAAHSHWDWKKKKKVFYVNCYKR